VSEEREFTASNGKRKRTGGPDRSNKSPSRVQEREAWCCPSRGPHPTSATPLSLRATQTVMWAMAHPHNLCGVVDLFKASA
jgi:hypothetical protein